jgi:phosphoserine aminotransferase
MPENLRIPPTLLPRDGRFGSGPSRIRDEQVEALAAAQPGLLGTSHRQPPVKNLVGHIRAMLGEFFGLPDGYEVLLGNGGSILFFDAAAYSLVRNRTQNCVFGEFGAKFAQAAAAPHLEAPSIVKAEPGSVALPRPEEGIDVYAWPHCETSTGAIAPVTRPDGIGDGLVVIDATSAAGGTMVDVSQADVYFFAPQKSFASDGGLWFALVSPAAVDRIEEVASSGRYVPASLNLKDALDNSRLDQTLNTPAIATLVLMGKQLEWLLAGGGLEYAAGRSKESSDRLYAWADDRPYTEAFVTHPSCRSTVVGTVDLVGVDSGTLRKVLKANGIVDIDPYRKLGRNQIRVGMYPATEPDDVSALTASIDWVVERLGGEGTGGEGRGEAAP